jgi:uncharacterized protein (TIGR00730 family)
MFSGGNHQGAAAVTVSSPMLDAPMLQCHIGPMAEIRSICVYCGSGPGTDPAFVQAAREFGKVLGENRLRLVYGGGDVGMMGAVATATFKHGGKVTGVIPEFLMSRERIDAHANGQELIPTKDLHERKRLMYELADAFVALPGGIGTLEELIEQMTWAQLGRHRKPILIANIKGFWNPLLTLIDHMGENAFIRSGMTVSFLVADKVEDILPKLVEAARSIPEEAKEMQAASVERM